jgi:hypothetical protein
MVLPLGEAGFRAAPNEAAFMASLKDQFKEEGLYIFPAPEDRPGMTSAEKSKAMEAAMAKARTGPAGLLLAYPNGEAEMTALQLGRQFVADILVMMVGAWILSKAAIVTGYFARVALVTALALVPILQVHVPYWNWYGFPATFTLAAAATNVIGFFFAGLVLARVVNAGPK